MIRIPFALVTLSTVLATSAAANAHANAHANSNSNSNAHANSDANTSTKANTTALRTCRDGDSCVASLPISLEATPSVLGPLARFDGEPAKRPAGDKPTPNADEAKLKAAITALDKAFSDGGTPERVRAIETAAILSDPAVIERIAKGLRDKDLAVARAAIEALRFSKHPDALEALHGAAKREARIHKEPEVHAALLRAIGQHGSATSIDVLVDDLWSHPDARVVQARILGLGHVRSRASLEKLIDLMRVAGPNKVQPFMEHFRVSLMVLTGADQGTSQDAWMRWWNEKGARTTVADKPAPLPKQLQVLWDAYWGESKPTERPTKRSERGQDDPEKSSGGK